MLILHRQLGDFVHRSPSVGNLEDDSGVDCTRSLSAGRGSVIASHLMNLGPTVGGTMQSMTHPSIWTDGTANLGNSKTESAESAKLRAAFESGVVTSCDAKMIGSGRSTSATVAMPGNVESSSKLENAVFISSDAEHFKLSHTVQSILQHIGDVIDHPLKEETKKQSDTGDICQSPTGKHDLPEGTQNLSHLISDTDVSEGVAEESDNNNTTETDRHKVKEDALPTSTKFQSIFASVTKPKTLPKLFDNEDDVANATTSRRSYPEYHFHGNHPTDAASKDRRSTFSLSPTGRESLSGGGIFTSKSSPNKAGGVGRGSLLKLIRK